MHDLLVGFLAIRSQKFLLVCLAANRLDVESRTIIGDIDHHLRTFTMQPHRDAARCGFSCGLPFVRCLEAVNDGIAEHVFERRQHLFQYLAVEFAGCPFDSEFSSLSDFQGRLTHEPRQPRHVPLERHHARTHQTILQFCGDACLLYQQRFSIGGYRLQQVLEAAHVARRFCKRS